MKKFLKKSKKAQEAPTTKRSTDDLIKENYQMMLEIRAKRIKFYGLLRRLSFS
jgi:hypothetical protein